MSNDTLTRAHLMWSGHWTLAKGYPQCGLSTHTQGHKYMYNMSLITNAIHIRHRQCGPGDLCIVHCLSPIHTHKPLLSVKTQHVYGPFSACMASLDCLWYTHGLIFHQAGGLQTKGQGSTYLHNTRICLHLLWSKLYFLQCGKMLSVDHFECCLFFVFKMQRREASLLTAVSP